MSPPPMRTDHPFPLRPRRRRLRSVRLHFPYPLSRPREKRPVADDRRTPYEDEADAEYRLFLEHTRVDGKSYVFEMDVGGAGPPLRLRYEGDGDEDDSGVAAIQPQPQMLPESDSTRKSWEANARRETKSPDSRPSEASDPFTSPSNALVDEDYLEFVKRVRAYGSSMILEWENNVTIIYEEEVKEIEHLGNESILSHHFNSLELQQIEDVGRAVEILQDEVSSSLQHSVSSSFKSRLMRVLEQPFDHGEYEHLKSLINLQKPMVKYKHLRDESRPYATNQMGHSYLHHFPDLARKVESADPDRILFLLRGFFFWLENLSHEDAYMPWAMDDSNKILQIDD